MKESPLYQVSDFPRSAQHVAFHEGDILLFNTQADSCLPSEYVGRYHVHILCHGGKAQFGMADKVYTLEAGDWAIWQIGSDIDDALYSSDFNADFLLVDRIFLIENNPENIWATKGYVFIKENPVYHLNDKDKAMLAADFGQMKHRLEEDHLFRKEILGNLMQIFLYDLWQIYKDVINKQTKINGPSVNLFQRFMDLVRQYCSTEREVAFYTDRLCISPKYLSEISKRSSGRPASYWIQGYATQEIISLLKKQDLSLAEISDRLHFYNPVHFCRFFKKMLGISPSEYRKKNQ